MRKAIPERKRSRKKSASRPDVYEGRIWTPLFEDLPPTLDPTARAVYGQIHKRTVSFRDRESTASAQTIGKAIGTSEKTVDRKIAVLLEGCYIERTFGGKDARKPSHYRTLPKARWKVSAGAKTSSPRVKASKTEVNLPVAGAKVSGHKGRRDPEGEYIGESVGEVAGNNRRENGSECREDYIQENQYGPKSRIQEQVASSQTTSLTTNSRAIFPDNSSVATSVPASPPTGSDEETTVPEGPSYQEIVMFFLRTTGTVQEKTRQTCDRFPTVPVAEIQGLARRWLP